MQALTLFALLVGVVVVLVDAAVLREKRNLRQPQIYPNQNFQRPNGGFPGGYNQRPIYNQQPGLVGGRPYHPGQIGGQFGVQKQPSFSGSQSSSNSQSLSSGGGRGGQSGSSSSSSSQSISQGGGRGGLSGSSSQSSSSSQSQGGRFGGSGSGSQSSSSSNSFSGK